MPRVVTLLLLGVVCVGLGLVFLATLVQLMGLFEPRVVIQVTLPRRTDETLNDFIFNDSQYCRPFLQSTNPQVVRVSHQFTVPVETQGHSANCSGVVIGPRSVLTAKHCVEWAGGTLVGGTVTTLTGQSFEVTDRIPDSEEDIVLILVDKPLEIEPPKIAHRIPMALTLEGYGCLQEASMLPLQRQAITLMQRGRILFLAGCVCHGDSGGPIYDDEGALVALMYWTENDGKAGRGVLIQDFIEHKPSRIR